MAPEVLDGAIQFTRDAFLRIDVYALGLVIWELMTRAHGPGDAPPDENAPPRLPPYMAPFEAEVGPIPTMDKLQHYVAKLKNRPRACSWWEKDQVSTTNNVLSLHYRSMLNPFPSGLRVVQPLSHLSLLWCKSTELLF